MTTSTLILLLSAVGALLAGVMIPDLALRIIAWALAFALWAGFFLIIARLLGGTWRPFRRF